MSAILLHRFAILLLVFFLAAPSALRAVDVPTPPVIGWTTDGVSASDGVAWPADAVPQLLGVWGFDSPTNLTGFRADPPILVSNLFLVPSPWGSALRLAPDSPACLRFGIRQSNTNGDFSVRNGAVSLWLRPDWTAGGPGAPAAPTPLVEAGTNSPSRNGWWAWVVSPGGGEVQLIGQARGQQVTFLRAPVPFVANRWTHLAVGWSPTNSALYADGVLLANGTGVTHWPAAAVRESVGWGAGGDRSGQLRIRGDVDLLFTANHPLTAAQVRSQFLATLAAQGSGPTASPASETLALLQEFATPTLPDAFRSGLWIEGGLGADSRGAGGWIRGTSPGVRYELFAANDLAGPWTLDQAITGSAAQTWTPFALSRYPSPAAYVLASPFTDADQDGLSDEFEGRVSRTHERNADSDADGMPDGWEVTHGLNPNAADGLADKDSDGFPNGLEYLYQQDPSVRDPVPLISARASTPTLTEGAPPGRFILRRTGSTAKPLTVRYALTGSAVSGYDFLHVPGNITFAAGRAEAEVIISPLVDGRDETDEAVVLTVARGTFYGRDSVFSAQMSLRDADVPTVSIRASDPDASEPEFAGPDPGEFEVIRSGLTHAALVVQLKPGGTAMGGQDLSPLPVSITIPAGETRKTIPVIPLNNRKLTGPRTCTLEILPADAYDVNSGANVAQVAIADVEPQIVTVTAVDAMAEEKNLGIGRFKFARAGVSSAPLTITYQVGGTATPGPAGYARNPQDYAALPESVTIPAGSNEALVDVVPFADTDLETLETVEVTITGSLDYTIGTANSAVVTIDDSNAATWTSRLVRPTSVAGANGPEGLIEVTRFGTVLTDMTLPFQVSGQRILRPSGQVLPFGDPRLAGLPASFLLTVTGGRLGSVAGTFVIPKGIVRMRVGLKANLPSAEVKGASLILNPAAVTSAKHDVFFLDAWNLVSIQSSAESVAEGAQVTVRLTAAATDPAASVGTSVRFTLLGNADPDADVTFTGSSGSGIDEDGLRYVDVTIPPRPATVGGVRSATLTVRATSDGRAEASPELLVLRYDPGQLTTALGASQQARPYAPLQIRDTTAMPLPPLDCDQDGFPDAYEFNHDMDPLTPSLSLRDTDRDGIPDLPELTSGTQVDDTDSDNDGVNDFIEGLLGSDPRKADAALAASVRDYVPVRLRTTGVLREPVGTCFQCHAPGMTLGGVEQLSLLGEKSEAMVVKTRTLLLAPGTVSEVGLTAPPGLKVNPSLFKTYSAEILPVNPQRPPGFLVYEADTARPLLGQGRPVDTAAFSTRKATLRVLRRPRLALDADRDGNVRFDATDATSPARPYRFWVNNDNDVGVSNDAPEALDSAVQDHTDGIIRNIRDLEDFSRLWVDLQGLNSLPSQAGLEMALEWRNVTQGAPAIQIYNAVETSGGLGYLTDLKVAGQQALPNAVLPGFAHAISVTSSSSRRIAAGSRFILPLSFRVGPQSRRHLLWEAAAPGAGSLVLMLIQDGRVLVESDPIHLELLDVKQMYSRVQATPPEAFRKPYEFWTEQPPAIDPGIAPLLPEFPYRPDPEAEPVTVTFVHGWNMRLNETINFSETLFKRLWHAGYRGHLASFRWPTDALLSFEVLDNELFDSYNFSEHRALVYGRSLSKFFATFGPSERRPIICHSMGGVVVSSALAGGLSTPTVLFMQAAAPASFFDLRTALNVSSLVLAEALAPFGLNTPDLFGTEAGYRGYLLANPAAYRNYCNTEDFALQTGSYAKNLIEANWIQNQAVAKPHLPFNNSQRGYIWLSSAESGLSRPASYVAFRALKFMPFREVLDDFENMAFVARSRTRALGAEPNTMGQFQPEDFRNLFFMGLDRSRGDHSGQFTKPIQETGPIYRSLKTDLE